MPDLATRPLDVVVFGATGFVGRLVAGHLAEAAPPNVRVGLAGRSPERLEAVRGSLPDRARSWPLLEAHSGERASLDRLAASARVVVSTVGPYARHGLALVEACAAAGTSYADLTGEVPFIRDSIDRAHAVAEASGARIVHACGFDSVPSDLGLQLAAERASRDGAGTGVEAVLVLMSARGALSGGTIDSIRTLVDAAKSDRALRRLLGDPYALSPDRAAEADLGPQRDAFLARREDAADGRWVAPFPMAGVNTRVVRRSNALQGWSYGRRLRYREVMAVGHGSVAPVLAAAAAVGTAAFAAGMALPPSRAVLDRLLPGPGAGPSAKTRKAGHFHTRTVLTTADGSRYRTTIRAQGDPGYAATAVMVGECALALAVDPLPQRAGVLTPASAIGTGLTDRLRGAGFGIDVEAVVRR